MPLILLTFVICVAMWSSNFKSELRILIADCNYGWARVWKDVAVWSLIVPYMHGFAFWWVNTKKPSLCPVEDMVKVSLELLDVKLSVDFPVNLHIIGILILLSSWVDCFWYIIHLNAWWATQDPAQCPAKCHWLHCVMWRVRHLLWLSGNGLWEVLYLAQEFLVEAIAMEHKLPMMNHIKCLKEVLCMLCWCQILGPRQKSISVWYMQL